MDTITLRVLPRQTPMSWDEFRETFGPYSVAIDGFVTGGPQFDSRFPAVNFNHHEDVARLATRATSAQVLLAIRMGFFRTFRDSQNHDLATATVFANDCDEDVCLAWFLIKEHVMAESLSNPLINRLVNISELLDTTAGLIPFSPDLAIMQQIAWIFEPYREFRISGRLDRRDAKEFRDVIDTVCGRIKAHVLGEGKAIPMATKYARLGGGHNWAMINEIEPFGRVGAFADGVRAFVSPRQGSEGKYRYSIGRASEFIPFPVPTLLRALNQAEAVKNGEPLDDSWGGSDIIGGSPRSRGSLLTPDEVERVVNTVLA